MKIRLSCLAALLSGAALCAQTATDPNEGLRLTYDAVANPTYPFSLKWYGKPNLYYFVQMRESLTSGSWTRFPYGVKGQDGLEGVDIENNVNQMIFYRLEMEDDIESELLSADFSESGVPNWIQMDLGFNPFIRVDTDGSGLSDPWQMHFFGHLGVDPEGNGDGDLTDNLEESQLGLDPNEDESDATLIYTYDALGRLTNVSGNQNAIAYTLDEEGNITLVD
ncbi:hypothetical protein [Ruficoccus sp. ZRK36]|uniref:hypothetical protein n=1 Tax=Ruficoccus sp. ZRK36 TaxID=2866311 RepID=UPI001C736D05|nr:hypothetical protein [Ruficoccus sp. ZRK36]QYY34565.1 hypothetical protein K0V07_09645 [Ruficoccus sp. ZRK36]